MEGNKERVRRVDPVWCVCVEGNKERVRRVDPVRCVCGGEQGEGEEGGPCEVCVVGG